MKFANFFCHANILLHSTTIHHSGILSFLYNPLFCVLQFNVPLIYNSTMGLQHSMKIKTLLLSNALMSLDLLDRPLPHVERMEHGALHLPYVEVSVN